MISRRLEVRLGDRRTLGAGPFSSYSASKEEIMIGNRASPRWAKHVVTMAWKRAAKNGKYPSGETKIFDDFLLSHVAAWIDKAAAQANVPPKTLAKRIASRLS
jgi:hypothetical protein